MRYFVFHHASTRFKRGAMTIGVAAIVGIALWAFTRHVAVSSGDSTPRASSVADAREMIPWPSIGVRRSGTKPGFPALEFGASSGSPGAAGGGRAGFPKVLQNSP